MNLPQDVIKKFKDIYHQEFGQTITDDEASELGERLINLMEIISRPIPGIDFQINKHDKTSRPRSQPLLTVTKKKLQ
jgi:hypothetical protein